MKNIIFSMLVIIGCSCGTQKAAFTHIERPPQHFYVETIDTSNLIEFSTQEGLFYLYKDDYGYYITNIPENHIHPIFKGSEKDCEEKLANLLTKV